METIIKDMGNNNNNLFTRLFDQISELTYLLDREVNQLSGGELQRFAIATAAVQVIQ